MMTKYSDIEIQTANNLLECGYKWIARYADGDVGAFSEKPYKKDLYWLGGGKTLLVSGKLTPMYPSIKWTDDEPTYIEDIIKPQILDDAERRYLSAVIRPFRDRVKHICKVNYSGTSSSEYQYLFITLSDFSYNIDLPIFKGETMYKGMTIAKDYTLEELGL